MHFKIGGKEVMLKADRDLFARSDKRYGSKGSLQVFPRSSPVVSGLSGWVPLQDCQI